MARCHRFPGCVLACPAPALASRTRGYDTGSGKPTAIYPRILRTYAQRARPLLVIGAFILVPIGLIDALGRRAETIDAGKVDHLTAVA